MKKLITTLSAALLGYEVVKADTGLVLGGNEYLVGLSFGFNFFKKGVLSF